MDYTEFHCSCICVLHSSLHSAYYTAYQSVCYSPFPRWWDSTWSSQCKTKSSMVITGLFSNGSFEKRPELWPSGFRFAFRRAFRVSSSRERALHWVYSTESHWVCYSECFTLRFTQCVLRSVLNWESLSVTQLSRCSTGALKINECYT